MKSCETGLTIYCPQPRGLESLTIYRYIYKGSILSTQLYKGPECWFKGSNPGSTSRKVVRHSTNRANRSAVNWICQGSNLTKYGMRVPTVKVTCLMLTSCCFNLVSSSISPSNLSLLSSSAKSSSGNPNINILEKQERLNGVHAGCTCRWMHYGAIRMKKRKGQLHS